MSIGKIYKLLDKMDMLLIKGMHIPLIGKVAVDNERINDILDKIKASIPGEIQEANNVLARRDSILVDAQNKSDQIVREAMFKAQELVKDSEVLKAVQLEAEKIKNQVVNECEGLRNKTENEIHKLKVTSINEAISIREGADKYADSILSRLDNDLAQIHGVVKDGQKQMAKFKTDSISNIANLKSLLAATERQDSAPVNSNHLDLGSINEEEEFQIPSFEKWEL